AAGSPRASPPGTRGRARRSAHRDRPSIARNRRRRAIGRRPALPESPQDKAIWSRRVQASFLVPLDIERQLAIQVLVLIWLLVDSLAEAYALYRVVVIDYLGAFDRFLTSFGLCPTALNDIFRCAFGQSRRWQADHAKCEC